MNVLDRFYAMKPYIQGKSWEEIFPRASTENFNYRTAKAGHCLICDLRMRPEDMFPRDRLTPRAICPTCWSTITSRLNRFCWVCTLMLDFELVHAQQNDMGNLHHRIHTGRCADYFSAVSAIALGKHIGLVMSRPQPALPQPAQRAIAYERQTTVDDIINMVPTREREYVPAKKKHPLLYIDETLYK
jgi:hypothetical protein